MDTFFYSIFLNTSHTDILKKKQNFLTLLGLETAGFSVLVAFFEIFITVCGFKMGSWSLYTFTLCIILNRCYYLT